MDKRTLLLNTFQLNTKLQCNPNCIEEELKTSEWLQHDGGHSKTVTSWGQLNNKPGGFHIVNVLISTLTKQLLACIVMDEWKGCRIRAAGRRPLVKKMHQQGGSMAWLCIMWSIVEPESTWEAWHALGYCIHLKGSLNKAFLVHLRRCAWMANESALAARRGDLKRPCRFHDVCVTSKSPVPSFGWI